MRSLLLIVLFIFALSAFAKKPFALFSPGQGSEAFELIFDKISNAKESVYVTVYSWKMAKLQKSLESALKNGAEVRVVMAPRHELKVETAIKELEKQGAHIRVSIKNLHEKFVMVDNKFAMNTSANFSYGAKSLYSESFVFFSNDPNKNEPEDIIFEDLLNEFTIVWNAAREDKWSLGQPNTYAAPLYTFKKMDDSVISNRPSKGNIVLKSSSMNFKAKMRTKDSSNWQKKGNYLSLTKQKTMIVKDGIVKAIDNAKRSVLFNINYLLLEDIYDAAVRAYERGVVVRMLVENKEYGSRKDYSNTFAKYVAKKKKSFFSPVRYKFFSFKAQSGKSFLNHNKTVIIDYDAESKTPIIDSTILITGSHNLSYNAEKVQFDSMIFYKGKRYKNLYQEFTDDFYALWGLNRTKKDEPINDIVEYYSQPVKNQIYRIHGGKIEKSITMRWDELNSLYRKMRKTVPGMFKAPLSIYKSCDYYNKATKEFMTYKKKKFIKCVAKKQH